MKHIVFFSFCLLLPLQVQAKKPVSLGMAECAAYYQAAVEIGEKLNTAPETLNNMAERASAFQAHAYMYAENEGRKKPADFIDMLIPKYHYKWSKHFPQASTLELALKTTESSEWAEYCDEIANQYKIIDSSKEQ